MALGRDLVQEVLRAGGLVEVLEPAEVGVAAERISKSHLRPG